MIKEVVRSGAEVIKIKRPATARNGQTNIVLLVTLATQRQKSLIRRDTENVGEIVSSGGAW